MPGMTFELGTTDISGKCGEAVEKFLSSVKSQEEFQHAFLAVLKSLLKNGDWMIVPKMLHVLLDSTRDKDGMGASSSAVCFGSIDWEVPFMMHHRFLVCHRLQ